MAKNVDTMARQAYKRAVVQFLAQIQAIYAHGDVGVRFWQGEMVPILGRHLAKLASVELPEVKHGKANGTPDAVAALATMTAERDALAKRLASLGRGERHAVREARAEASEAWQRLEAAKVQTYRDEHAAALPPCEGCNDCAHEWGCDSSGQFVDGGCDFFAPSGFDEVTQ